MAGISLYTLMKWGPHQYGPFLLSLLQQLQRGLLELIAPLKHSVFVPAISTVCLLFPITAHMTCLSQLKSMVYEKAECNLSPASISCIVSISLTLSQYCLHHSEQLISSTESYICSTSIDRSKSYSEER